MHMHFTKNNAAHAACERQCWGHVLVPLARIHSHTAPRFDFLKLNDSLYANRGDPLHSEPLFFPSLGPQLKLGRGHLTFIAIQVKKWIVIPLGHAATHIYLNKSIHVSLSLFFTNQV